MKDNIDVLLLKWILSSSPVDKAGLLGNDYNIDKRKLMHQIIYEFAKTLNFSEQYEIFFEDEFKLRLCMHLCPQSAMHWDESKSKSPLNRVELIQVYLENEFNYAKADADAIARSVAKNLRDWEEKRKNRLDVVDRLLSQQSNKCAACHVLIQETRIIEEENKDIKERDNYKPYFQDPGVRTWLSAEVDHRLPVSRYGVNRKENLQVLCRLCNQGKSNSFVSSKQEYENSKTDIKDIDYAHRRRLLYWRLEIDNFQCTSCKHKEKELTVRKRSDEGGLILSNLYSSCYDCLL